MPREILSRVTDGIRSRLPEQRGLKTTLRREVKSVLDYYDKSSNGGPISALHANRLTVGKLSDGEGSYVEIATFTPIYRKDRITLRGNRVKMQRVEPEQAFSRERLSRGEVVEIVSMLQNVTVPYREAVRARKEKREKAKNLLGKVKGRLPASIFGWSLKRSGN